MDTNALIRDMLNLGMLKGMQKHGIPMEQQWPPDWLEYEQPGASVYHFDAPATLRGFYGNAKDPNNLYLNTNRGMLSRPLNEVARHEAAHRQQYLAEQRDKSHWSRFQRDTPKDLEDIIKRHMTTTGNDTATYHEALATLSGLMENLKGKPGLEALKRELAANPNWQKNYQYDYEPLFNVKE